MGFTHLDQARGPAKPVIAIHSRDVHALLTPGRLLSAFRRRNFPRKLGFGECFWGRRLARLGVTWVEFDELRWKLNLANDTHRWLVYGEYEEPALRKLLERIIQPGSVIVDSGANIGQMVLMYLLHGSPAVIHAFEPTAAARAWLQECVAANRLSNVHVTPLALGEKSGRANLVEHDFGQKEGAQNRLDLTGEGVPVEVTTLDAYAAEAWDRPCPILETRYRGP